MAKSLCMNAGTTGSPNPRALVEMDGDEKLRQERVLEMIRSGEHLRIPKIAEKLHCSYSTAKRTVDVLKAEGRIEFTGSTKTGHYQLPLPSATHFRNPSGAIA